MQALSQFLGLESLESIIDCSRLMVVPKTPLSDAIALIATQSQDLIHPNHRQKFASKHFWAIANIVYFQIKHQIFLKKRSSEYKWLLTHAIVRKDPKGKPASLIGVCVDITCCVEAKEEQLALKKNEECFCILAESMSQEVWKAQEKQLSKLKSRFLAMTPHEFRTPLTTILSSCELLEHYRHKWTEEKQLINIHQIKSAVKRMTEILNDVLVIGNCKKVSRYSSS